MSLTKEQYVEIGSEFPSEDVIAQIADSLALATRDAVLLAEFGWTAAKSEELKALGQDLETKNREYQRKFGVHVGTTKEAGTQVDLGKRWRLRAISIGENHLKAENAIAELKKLMGPAGRDPKKLGEQVKALLGLAQDNEKLFREGGADDAFFAEGKRLSAALEKAASAKRQRPKDLPAEHDVLDELDGRAWELLKILARSGRRAQVAAGNRGLAAGYNLDALYRRPQRRPAGGGGNGGGGAAAGGGTPGGAA